MRARSRSLVRRCLAGLAIGLWLVMGVVPVPAAGQGSDIAVIVHPDVPVSNLSLAELRRLLLGDREFWSSGVRVTLLIRAPIARERDVAVKDVCQMSEAQFRQHWIGKVFRADTPSGPKIVYSSEMAIEQVSRLPGAISFVEASRANTAKTVKVLRIDGRAPGQPGYLGK
jgi:ABC-type phosphate transport system substrate-binding protein